MGGDNAPLEIVKGALLGMEHWGVEVLLTGDTEAILRALRDCGHDTIPRGMEIVHTTETVEMCDDPSKVFRHKKDTSMGVGLTLLRDGKADALVSAGSTGALLAGATLITKRIRGIRRAAMAPVIPTTGGKAVLIDCGANGFLKYWLLYVYAMFGGCLLTRDRRRKYAVAGVLAAVTLALAVGLNTGLHQYGHLSVMALDVGQGESVALYTREKAVLVDCGSSNSYISAGARAADQLESMGIHRLSAVAVTHYHADHTNGLEELLARMPVERLLLPEIQDEYGVRDRLLALARELDIPVTMVTDTYQFPMGQAMLTVYPPVGAGYLNEQGLTFLCSAGDFDALITGDMAGNTEKKLVERFDLPDIEVLVVGHHGSRYSSTDAFLQQMRPETAIISVGDNSYGHPTQEAMDRLSRNGAAVYRTDRQGNVLVTVNGGT